MDSSVSSPMASQSRVDAGGTRDKFIAIGIDFGTTFSGVSWAFSEQPDIVHEISEWPAENHMNQQEVQVPTVYDIDSGKWGYQVTPDMKPVKWFKPLLLNDVDLAKEENQEVSRSKQLREARNQLSKTSAEITAVDLVGHYLRNLWDHTYKTLKTMVDIDNISLRVVIAVPAIWPNYAHNAMREAAKLAGITKKRLIGTPTLDLVQEPEAASLSIIKERSLLAEIKPGESFVVCNAGGGPVDVISYTVVSNDPFRLKECVKGDGGLCGAVRIDEAFEAHLMGKSRLRLNMLSVSEYNTHVVDGWERGVKRTFTDAVSPAEFSLWLGYKVFNTRDRLRNREHLSLNRAEVSGFFNKSLTGIRMLVSNQRQQVILKTGSYPKNVLLVGGLSDSLYVYNVLNDFFDGTVLRSLNGWSAVARGAVIRLLHDYSSSQVIHIDKEKNLLPQVMQKIVKQPGTDPFEQAYVAHASSTFPDQDNRQEEEDKPREGNTLVRHGNKRRAIVYHVDQNGVQQAMIEQAVMEQDELIGRLREDLRKAKNELLTAQQKHEKEVAELENNLTTLRNEVAENATRSVEMPLQLPLHCPEGEIMRAWQNLTYDVGNLVSNHFRESKGDKTVTWAERKTDYLKNLTPHYKEVVKERKTAPAFIEAAIWNALCLCVFGPYRTNSPFCWAGKYRGSLKTMSNLLLADIDRMKSDRHTHQAMFHQWKALTANLVATIVSPERLEDEKTEIAEDIGDMISGLLSPKTSQHRLREIRMIVDKAVDLATRFCGQKRWYCVAWFPERCHDVPLDDERMELMVESPKSNHVRFMVRPGLYGSQGGDYNSMCVLDRCLVWAA